MDLQNLFILCDFCIRFNFILHSLLSLISNSSLFEKKNALLPQTQPPTHPQSCNRAPAAAFLLASCPNPWGPYRPPPPNCLVTCHCIPGPKSGRHLLIKAQTTHAKKPGRLSTDLLSLRYPDPVPQPVSSSAAEHPWKPSLPPRSHPADLPLITFFHLLLCSKSIRHLLLILG